MSTRCCIVIKDEHSELFYYRHSDGYPEVTGKSLKRFMQLVRDKKIRDNVSQAAGWLIVLGHEEYKDPNRYSPYKSLADLEAGNYDPISHWKVGAYEPTTGIHGDIEYLYEINLSEETLIGWEHDGEHKGRKVFTG